MSEPSIYQQVFDLFAASHWTQGSYCTTRSSVLQGDVKTCYCLVGGFAHISGVGSRSGDMATLLAPVLKAIPREDIAAILDSWEANDGTKDCYADGAFEAAREGDFSRDINLNHDLVVTWNDESHRTRADVLAALRAAHDLTGDNA